MSDQVDCDDQKVQRICDESFFFSGVDNDCSRTTGGLIENQCKTLRLRRSIGSDVKAAQFQLWDFRMPTSGSAPFPLLCSNTLACVESILVGECGSSSQAVTAPY